MKYIICLIMCYCSILKGQNDTTKSSIKSGVLSVFTTTETINSTISDSINGKSFYSVKNSPHTYPVNRFVPDSTNVNYKKPVLKKTSLGDKSTLKKIKYFIPSGTIALGYDYGFLPYTTSPVSPASALRSEGQVSLNIFNIPLNVSYFYSSQKNLIGLNNYFRISYDASRYKDQLNNKLSKNIDSYQNQLGGLNTEKQQLLQKMAYSDYLSTISPDKWPVGKSVVSKPGISNPIQSMEFPDTTGIKNKYSTDYDTTYKSKKDSLFNKGVYYKYKTDSVKRVYNEYRDKYDLINDSIKKTQNKIDQIESLMNGNTDAYKYKIPYFNKAQNFLSGIKRFEIGLCYPNHSIFLANNIPVRGINMEYEKNDLYIALTYGTTISTLLYNSKSADGFLQNVRNSYNYFDFNSVAAGRKILAVKFGAGIKEKNHVFIGFMIGKGQASYIGPFNETPSYIGKESNVVLEVDLKHAVGKNTTAELVLGKSSLKEEELSYEVIRSSMKEIFSNYRTYALQAKLNTKIPLTKTSLGFSFRYIDPFFKSFGIGFMRSDNMRYEIKLDQPITKKLRYTGMFRYEEDNLLRIMNYKNKFYSINNTVSYKIKRGLMARFSYTPLIRTLTSKDYVMKNNNSISTAVITFSPKTRKVSAQFDMLYNYYIVNTDSNQLNFQNVSYNHQFTFKTGFKTGLNVSWFKNTLSDTLNNNIFFALLDIGFKFKNGSSVTLAGKSAYKMNGTFYPGFIIKTNLKLHKSLYWENQVEKFIVGDLFNGYDLENLKQFPYCFSTRLILNF